MSRITSKNVRQRHDRDSPCATLVRGLIISKKYSSLNDICISFFPAFVLAYEYPRGTQNLIIKKVEELTMKKTFFEKLSAMLTGYYKSFSMDF